jgi:hypothetical protein
MERVKMAVDDGWRVGGFGVAAGGAGCPAAEPRGQRPCDAPEGMMELEGRR